MALVPPQKFYHYKLMLARNKREWKDSIIHTYFWLKHFVPPTSGFIRHWIHVGTTPQHFNEIFVALLTYNIANPLCYNEVLEAADRWWEKSGPTIKEYQYLFVVVYASSSYMDRGAMLPMGLMDSPPDSGYPDEAHKPIE